MIWQCSATCGHGAGNKTRTVSCQQSTPSGADIEVDITSCPLPVPHTVEECDNEQCPPYWIARSASRVRTWSLQIESDSYKISLTYSMKILISHFYAPLLSHILSHSTLSSIYSESFFVYILSQPLDFFIHTVQFYERYLVSTCTFSISGLVIYVSMTYILLQNNENMLLWFVHNFLRIRLTF